MPEQRQGDHRDSHLRQLRRRAPFYLLVVGLAVLVVRYYQRQPETFSVEYNLGAALSGLRQMRARYFRRGAAEEMHRVAFEFPRADGDEAVRHRVRLPEGDYDVRIELFYRDRVPPPIRSLSRPSGPRSVRMRRPLLVRGPGLVKLFIAEER